jgi:hypothetical protein
MKPHNEPEAVLQVQQAVKMMEEKKTGLVLSGRIKDGKVILDKATRDKVARKFPKGDIAFIAMNAPFDPKPELGLA